MFCEKCGSKIEKSETFCKKCGYKFEENPLNEGLTTHGNKKKMSKKFIVRGIIGVTSIIFIVVLINVIISLSWDYKKVDYLKMAKAYVLYADQGNTAACEDVLETYIKSPEWKVTSLTELWVHVNVSGKLYSTGEMIDILLIITPKRKNPSMIVGEFRINGEKHTTGSNPFVKELFVNYKNNDHLNTNNDSSHKDNSLSVFKTTLEDLMVNDIYFNSIGGGSMREMGAVMADLDNDGTDEMIVYRYHTSDNSIEHFKILDNENDSVNVNIVHDGYAPKALLFLSTNGYLYGQSPASSSSESFYIYEYKNYSTERIELFHSSYQFGDSSPTQNYSLDSKKISSIEYESYKEKYGLYFGTSVFDMDDVLGDIMKD